MSDKTADILAFVRAAPDDETPAKFPRLATLPGDLMRAVEAATERSPDGDQMLLAEIVELLKANNESVESMRHALLDDGGHLDRFAKRIDTNLSTHRSEVSAKIGKLHDYVAALALRLGLVETGSDSSIRAEQPFTCLVVDDEPEMRTIVAKVLQDAGVVAIIADGGEEALSLLRGETPIDVVLTDLHMPGNGRGLVSHIRTDHPRVEFIVMTGYEGGAASEALDAGAFSFLAKPFTNEALILTVTRAAEHRRLRARAAKVDT